MSATQADKSYFGADAAAGLYRPGAYHAAKTAAGLPFALVNIIAFAGVTYGLAGLRPEAAAVFANLLVAGLLYLIAAQVMTLAAVFAPTQDLAFVLSIVWTARRTPLPVLLPDSRLSRRGQLGRRSQPLPRPPSLRRSLHLAAHLLEPPPEPNRPSTC